VFTGGLWVAVSVEPDAQAEEVGQVEPHAPPRGDRLGLPQVRLRPGLIPQAGTPRGTSWIAHGWRNQSMTAPR
jgi:hypothetical protein